MAKNPVTVELRQDLPENWTNSDYVSPGGIEVGLSEKHGYNYLMHQVNLSQKAINEISQAFKNLIEIDEENPKVSVVTTLTHTKAGTIHVFTGLGERTGLVPCQFKSTSGYTEGDTATIDGTAYTITLTGADAPETDLFVSGKSILIDVDTEGKLINFKAGGGLTNGKLALATATENEVFIGKTFYSGDKILKTGKYDPDWAIKVLW